MFRFFYQHNNSVYCGNGSVKHFASCSVPIDCMEARSFASFTNTTILCIVGMEATFDIYMFDIYRRRLIIPELLWFFIYQKLILYFTIE
jgi:hypothetical protein